MELIRLYIYNPTAPCPIESMMQGFELAENFRIL